MVDADFSHPLSSDQRDDALEYSRDMFAVLAKMDYTAASNIPVGAIRLNTTARRLQAYNGAGWDDVDLDDAGVIKMFGGGSVPNGWLLCDGSAVSRSTYADLFSAIGTSFGVGDGSTTFNLPPSGRFYLNKAAAGTGSTLGETGGSLDHTHTGPSHTHTIAHTHDLNSHTHTLSAHTHGMNSHTHGMAHEHTVVGHYHSASGTQLPTTSAGNHAHEVYTRANSAMTAGNSGVVPELSAGTNDTVATTTTGAHTHYAQGTVGNVAGNDGDLNRATESGTKTVTDAATGNTGVPSSDVTGAASGSTAASSAANSGAGGTGNTGSANPAYVVVNFIIKT